MLHLLELIPFLGPNVIAPALDAIHGGVNIVQALLGI